MDALQTAFNRIRERIETDASGCWIWQGTADADGYGAIRVGEKVWRTHRVTYTVIHGPIPRGKVVRHKCDNARCCNPMHLEIGDHEDNTQDIVDRGRAKKRRILGEEQKAQILALRRAGATKRAIAEALHCNWYAVSKVLDEGGVDVVRQGRPKGSRNVHVKVTEEMKVQMRRLYATGQHSQQALAEQFGCDQTYVSLIVRGKK
jgi:hypothetical protein